MAAHLVQHHHSAALALLGGQVCQALVQALEHDVVQAVAASGAQFGVFLGRGVGVGNAVASALAARLVVHPQNGQACVLQHVHQPFKVGAARLVAIAAQVRKHARHRGRRAGAASPGVASADEVWPGRQQRGGVAFVAVDAKVARAAGFAQHQHQQRRLGLACVAGTQLGVAPHGQDGARVHAQRFGGNVAQRIDGVEGVDQVAQLGVVAHGGGKVLEHQQHRTHGHQHGGDEKPRVVQRVPQRCHRAHGLANQPRHWGHGQGAHGQRQLPVQQVARFLHIGLQHVGQHAGVNRNAVGQHEIGAKGRHQHQQASSGLERPAPRQQAEQGGVACSDQHHEGRQESPAANAGVAGQVEHFSPQRHIAHRGHPDTDPQHDPGGVQTLRRGL